MGGATLITGGFHAMQGRGRHRGRQARRFADAGAGPARVGEHGANVMSSFLAREVEAGEAQLPVILHDVRVLARRGAFPTASRRFGDLRLEDGRLQRLERAVEAAAGPEHAPELRALAGSRARMTQLEASCAAALERACCAEYEAAADALEQELLTHAELERRLNRSTQRRVTS
jgi:hypothetical protein